MRILLVGEYSRLHNSLKEGLQKLGHEAKIIGTGDYFKNFPVDFPLQRKYEKGISKKMRIGLYKLSKKDVGSKNVLKQFFSYAGNLKGYDCVQLINETPLGIQPKEEKKAVDFLKKYNSKLFLLSCGTDVPSVSYALAGKMKYSIFSPLEEKRASERNYLAPLKYTQPAFKKHHDYLYNQIIEGVIASDMDYHLPLKNNSQYLGLIPNPINIDKLQPIPLDISGKIRIFLGINRTNYYKKGIDFFEKALLKIKQKYNDKVDIITVENLPYAQYIKKYDSAHILLDQIYGYDQGYNALEAMAKGKVVFTGAEKEFLQHYRLQEDEVCINALPNVNQVVKKLGDLIENPDKIKIIGQNARRFIEKEHDYKKVAEQYIEAWGL